MSYSLYIDLVNGLRMCINRKIGFKRVYKMIHDISCDPDNAKMIQDALLIPYKDKNIIDDETELFICELVEEIIRVQNYIFYKLNETFSKLPLLNENLEKCGEAPRETINQARKAFNKLYINIWDVLAGRFDKYTSWINYSLDIYENPDRIFPLYIAKSRWTNSKYVDPHMVGKFKYPYLKCFLKNTLRPRKLYKFVKKHINLQNSLKPVNTHIRFP